MTLELVEEKVTVEVTDEGDHDRFQHYFDKKDISANLLNGTPMAALCGKVLARQVDPKGRPVCEDCKWVYEHIVGSNLPDGKDGS